MSTKSISGEQSEDRSESAKEKKNIIVVGLQSGTLLSSLLLRSSSFPHHTHRIIGIDERTVAYWSIGSLRAATVPGWEEKVVGSFGLGTSGIFGRWGELKRKGEGDHVLLVGWRVEEILWEEKRVRVRNLHPKKSKSTKSSESSKSPELESEEAGEEDEEEKLIEWDHLVLCTGSTYPFPCQPDPSSPTNTTRESILSSLRSLQASISNAHSILLLGGGPVGIEWAGEIKAHHPSKQVTVLSSSASLLPKKTDPKYDPRFGERCTASLRQMGIDLILGERAMNVSEDGKTVVTNQGRELQADLVLKAYGSAPRSSLLQTSKSDSLDSNSRIKVDEHLRVVGMEEDNVWAMGDVTSIPELKLARWAYQHARIVSYNIVTSISSSSQSQSHSEVRRRKLKTYKPSFMVQEVSIGPERGHGQIGMFMMAQWLVVWAFCRDLGTKMFRKIWPEPVNEDEDDARADAQD
ncbi:FAD/NAD(P)-binding domain-containing protein [Atractiella rhizophila]|nr:FAD/NAD(P)-binding domain-containing protein [Atractiella rhizophila]